MIVKIKFSKKAKTEDMFLVNVTEVKIVDD